MLALRIILFILAVVAFYMAGITDPDYYSNERSKLNIALNIIGVLLVFAFGVVQITTHWTVFAIPKILLLIAICIIVTSYFLSDEENEFYDCISRQIIVIIFSYIIGGIGYLCNIQKCENPDISVEKVELVNAKDNLSVKGSFSILGGEVHGEFVYAYYTKNEKGNFVLNMIPAENTEISYLSEREQPYLEMTTKTYYSLNTNHNPATKCQEHEKTSYVLYVPEGSIQEIFEFDAQ